MTTKKTFILRGKAASKGIVIGRVKIVPDSSVSVNFEKGDILVAPMTKPSMILLMNKASAIVTDTGGILCHAAILSRELGIPCIVGTYKATKILKDGVLIRVNGNKGLIEIIE